MNELRIALQSNAHSLLHSRGLFSWLLATGIALIAAVQLRPFLLWTPAELALRGFIIDDAFFYSVLGQNFYTSGTLTLDGAMTTNGVQPLWMGIQIALAGLLPNVDGMVLIARSSWLLYTLFAFSATLYVSCGSLQQQFLASMVLGGLLLLNHAFQLFVMRGLETPLLLLILLLTLFAVEWVDRRTALALKAWQVMLLALLAVLCFLARTDMFWVAIVVGGWFTWRKRPLRSHLLLFWGTLIILITPYLLFNLTTQGGVMPISGRVKLFYLDLVFPTLQSYLDSDEWRGLFSAFYRLLPLTSGSSLPLTAGLIGLAGLSVWHGVRHATLPLGVVLLTLMVAGHTLFMYAFYRELRPYTSYYFAAQLLWFALVIAYQVHAWSAAGGRLASIKFVSALTLTGLIVLLSLGAWRGRDWQPREIWAQRINLAQAIAQHVPSDANLGAFWPGAFTYFSQRHVTPLDGIIGSQEYFEAYVMTGRELNYLTRTGTGYLATWLPIPPEQILNQPAPPAIDEWSHLGTVRLWQNRHKPMRVVERQLVDDSGAGWYLLALEPGAHNTQ